MTSNADHKLASETAEQLIRQYEEGSEVVNLAKAYLARNRQQNSLLDVVARDNEYWDKDRLKIEQQTVELAQLRTQIDQLTHQVQINAQRRINLDEFKMLKDVLEKAKRVDSVDSMVAFRIKDLNETIEKYDEEYGDMEW